MNPTPVQVYESTLKGYQTFLSAIWAGDESQRILAQLRATYPTLTVDSAKGERALVDTAIVEEGFRAIQKQAAGQTLRMYFTWSKLISGPEGPEHVEHPRSLELCLADFALERLRFFRKACVPRPKKQDRAFEALRCDNWIVHEGLCELRTRYQRYQLGS
jgi:hypothetical protein